MVTATNLQFIRGDSFSFDILITNTATGDPENLTNGTLTLTAKWQYTDANAAAVFTKAIGSGITVLVAADGTANVTIAAVDTAALPYTTVNLVYDLEYVDSSGGKWTVLYGVINLLPDVTRA